MQHGPQRFRARVLLGVGSWTALIASFAVALARLPETERARATDALSDIARLATRGTVNREILFPAAYPWIEAGDGVYRREGFELLRCGQVLRVWESPEGRRIEVFFDPVVGDTLDSTSRFTAFSSGASMAWTFRSLLPEHVQTRITEEWERFVAANQERLTVVLLPMAKDLLREAGPLVLDEAIASLARHRVELDGIAARYREEFVEPRLIPLIENEIWPRLIATGGPALEAVGKELWDALPLLGLAWQGVKQEFDFSEEDRVNQRFREFLKDGAIPLLHQHAPALKDALLTVIRDAADDPEVSSTVRESLKALLSDTELRVLLVEVLDEVIRGERLRALVQSRLTDETAAKTIAELRKEIDEVFRSIGKKIVFSDETTYEVQPDFARFLRTLVLKKDRRWILFEPGAGAPTDPSATLLGEVAPE